MADITGWGRSTWGSGAWGESIPVEVTGVVGTTAITSVATSAGGEVGVTGVAGTTGLAGVNVWGLIDDSQTPNYSIISTTQNPNWKEVA